MAERTCVVCASMFTGKGVTCSPDCARLRRNERTREFFRRYKEEHGEAYTNRYREKRNTNAREYKKTWEYPREARVCQGCGAVWYPRRSDPSKHCTTGCSVDSPRSHRLPVIHPNPGHNPVSWLHPRHLALRPVAKDRTKRQFVGGKCARCNKSFVILGQTTNRFCSDTCSKAENRGLRRVRERKAFVAPVYRARIFERDGWRCQICKKKVRRSAVVPHPLAPVLDHITPLADGGTHEPANVQCAHYLCNSAKSAGAANDQLRLIG